MTRWDTLLDRLRGLGLRPSDEDYVENYGLYAVDEGRIPAERRFRCTRGSARLDDAQLELIAFPSAEEAADFLNLIRDEGGWTRVGRALLRLSGASEGLAERIVECLRAK